MPAPDSALSSYCRNARAFHGEVAMKPIESYFSEAVNASASDLHLVSGQRATIRVDGQLHAVEDQPFAAADLQQAVFWMLTTAQRNRYAETLELDISHTAGGGRGGGHTSN